MTTTAAEFVTTREVSFTEDGQTGERVFHVLGATTPKMAITASGVPQIGMAFPDDGNLIAVETRGRLVEGHSDLCEVLIRYRNKLFGIGQVTYERNTSASFEPVWRVSPSVPAGGNVVNDGSDDIGGLRVDLAGEPVTRLRRQMELQVTETIQRNEFDAILNLQFVGTRNNAVWKGFQAGTMLYLGARSMGAFSDYVEMVQHRFIYDSVFHLQQHPIRDSGGNIVLDTQSRAGIVVWRQPYTDLSTFANISAFF